MDELGPLTLRPGDRRIRAVVGQVPPAGDPWWVERSCARCGRAADPRSGALVVYGPHDSAHPVTAAVCSGCAAMLTPFRIAIDLERIRAVADPDTTCPGVFELVQRVVAMRADPPTDVLWTRARDIHVLARRLATTRTHLALRLGDLGVLAAAEVATSRTSGTARQPREITGRTDVLAPGAAGQWPPVHGDREAAGRNRRTA